MRHDKERKELNVKGLTLLELLIAVILVVTVLFGISAVGIYSVRQIAVDMERYNLYSQINFAFESEKNNPESPQKYSLLASAAIRRSC